VGKINTILNELLTDVGTVVEPVTLAQAKAYCRISNASEDSLLSAYITSSRQSAEHFTGCAFIPKLALVTLRNQCGGVALPHCPVDVSTVVVTVASAADTTSDKYGLTELDGTAQLLTATDDVLAVQFNCGYGTAGIHATFAIVPQGVKDGILAEINYRWANRGGTFSPGGLCAEARNYLIPFITKSLL
jgi:uncharacterized phiE125 gp8 family phage protein